MKNEPSLFNAVAAMGDDKKKIESLVKDPVFWGNQPFVQKAVKGEVSFTEYVEPLVRGMKKLLSLWGCSKKKRIALQSSINSAKEELGTLMSSEFERGAEDRLSIVDQTTFQKAGQWRRRSLFSGVLVILVCFVLLSTKILKSLDPMITLAVIVIFLMAFVFTLMALSGADGSFSQKKAFLRDMLYRAKFLDEKIRNLNST
jgi:hypothetical protein